ncbi:hypothetical protein J7T55_010286 [Diaporthe amygdali]|uniref:uncharacterized protein n=1 Tax=Phomopsis amygdali TaxID=1214568 RepID=UPI0022FF20F3|nr:uncharacterized protein J7T55_010286 [Diaporthe amygdali]KAJ0107680.1 hypothetical protein J7T55_010286 [Diaporthe amygdali]
MSVALLAPYLALDFPLAVKAGTAQNSGQARRAAVKCHQFGEVPDEEWGPGKLEFGSAARDLGDETPLHWHRGVESS